MTQYAQGGPVSGGGGFWLDGCTPRYIEHAPVTAVDVDALAKLWKAATAGPWTVRYPFTKLVDVPGREASITSESAADAALIVAAVNALEPLLAEVRRGRALREAVEGLAEEYQADGLRRDALGRPAWPLNVARRLRAAAAALDPS